MDLPLATVALGFGLGVSLAAPPGPILVLSADRAVHHGFWAGFIVTLGAMLGDATHATLMGFGILPFIVRVPYLPGILALVGGLLLLVFAKAAWDKARQPPDLTHAHGDDQGFAARYGIYLGGLAAGYFFALTSPFNIGWWISAGTALFRDHGAAVFYGFFLGLLATSAGYVFLVRAAARRVKGVVRVVSAASALILVLFAGVVLWNGAHELFWH